MEIHFDPTLVEQCTFLAIRQDPVNEPAFREAQEAVYALTDPEQRDDAFKSISAEWFFRLGLNQPAQRLISERPLIEQRVERCFFREAASRRKQGADLFVKTSVDGASQSRTLMVDLCPDTLLLPTSLASTLRPDLLKVSDMLDDAFAYSPDLPPADRPQQNLVRDRYRALWDVHVASRLRSEQRRVKGLDRSVRFRFIQAFTTAGTPPSEACLEALERLDVAAHAQFLEWAVSPQTLPGWSGGGDRPGAPGQACPLCGFATHDWYPAQNFTRGFVDRARSSYPAWSIEQGMCTQCVETIQADHASTPLHAS